MTDLKASDRDVDRAIRSWLHEDRHEDASRVAGAVLDLVAATPQRRVTWWPARRTSLMNKIVGFAGAAAAVAVAVVLGVGILGSPGQSGPGAAPATSPSASAAGPTATAEPSPSPSPPAPTLTQSFTSTQHGISVSYPEGWIAQAATGPWTESAFPLAFGEPHADWLSDPILESSLFLTIASQPIGDSAPEDWVARQMVSDDACTATEPIVVDGSTGLIGTGDCDVAVVTTAGRGYWIQLYTSDDSDKELAVAPYDRTWFEEFLATVQLRPEDAVDAGS